MEHWRRNIVRSEAGVAFPVALFGLLMVAVMMTGVLLSSATEVVISVAHQDAKRSLYTAEDGLDTYLGGLQATLNNGGDPVSQIVDLGDGRSAQITVAQVNSMPASGGNPAYETYSLLSRSLSGGGREVGVMLTIESVNAVTPLSLNSAATFAGAVNVSSSVTLSGTQTQQNCGLGVTKKSLTTLQGAAVTVNSSSVPQGRETLNLTRAQLKQQILGGRTIDDLYNQAQIKFPWGNNQQVGSSITFNSYSADKPESKAPVATYTPSSTSYSLGSHRINPYLPGSSHPYNWGCPYTTMGRSGCDWRWADTTFYPLVGIDAKGTTVSLNGQHGQGVLVIKNGRLVIGSTFHYKGIIIADGELDISSSARIDGAVVGFSEVSVQNNTHDLGGTTIITYDQCVLDRVNQVLTGGSSSTATRTLRRVFGWFEVVR